MTNPNMHIENIADDQITDGGELSVTTYYSPCVGIMNADGYLRVVCDAPGHYTETRVDHATLINAGWTPPQASPENIQFPATVGHIPLTIMLTQVDYLERERDIALSDFRQADTDSIRALHERNEARKQRDRLAEALIEMRYGHTDKAEKMAIEALSYLTK